MSGPALSISRRNFLAASAATGLLAVTRDARAAPPGDLRGAIPASGETIPAVGMGSWITFNAGGRAAFALGVWRDVAMAIAVLGAFLILPLRGNRPVEA